MISSKMRLAIIASLSNINSWQPAEIMFNIPGNRYPSASKSKGHAARQKRDSKKRKAK